MDEVPSGFVVILKLSVDMPNMLPQSGMSKGGWSEGGRAQGNHAPEERVAELLELCERLVLHPVEKEESRQRLRVTDARRLPPNAPLLFGGGERRQAMHVLGGGG